MSQSKKLRALEGIADILWELNELPTSKLTKLQLKYAIYHISFWVSDGLNEPRLIPEEWYRK